MKKNKKKHMNGSNTCIKDSGAISITICIMRVTTYLKLSQMLFFFLFTVLMSTGKDTSATG